MRRKEQNGLWKSTNAMTVFGGREHGKYIFNSLYRNTRRISINAVDDCKVCSKIFLSIWLVFFYLGFSRLNAKILVKILYSTFLPWRLRI